MTGSHAALMRPILGTSSRVIFQWEDVVAARLIDGKALAQAVREGLAATSAAVLAKTGTKPGLATILVGDDPASHVYVKNKQKACELAGIHVDDHKLSAQTTQAELLALIEKKNADPKIHGILVQLPLPKHIDSRVILEAVSPEKDADGFHPYNFGRLVEGHPVFEACTPKGVIKMIESTGVPIEGKRAVVVGRSNIVGKPLALMKIGMLKRAPVHASGRTVKRTLSTLQHPRARIFYG